MTTIPLSPALMLFSPTWRRYFPQTLPALMGLLPRDGHVVLHDLMALQLTYAAFLHYHETHISPPMVRTPELRTTGAS